MPKRPKDTRPQSERFIEAARELECDEDEDALKARMKRLAETKRQKPAPLEVAHQKASQEAGLGA
jgi:hypothetical protein